MTSDRARAYARVMKTLNDLGPAKLLASEQAQVRDAADTLLFCDDLGDVSARAAFSQIEALHWRLVSSGRWSAARAGELADEIYACGPALLELRAA
jgi:hypothetical protein